MSNFSIKPHRYPHIWQKIGIKIVLGGIVDAIRFDVAGTQAIGRSSAHIPSTYNLKATVRAYGSTDNRQSLVPSARVLARSPVPGIRSTSRTPPHVLALLSRG